MEEKLITWDLSVLYADAEAWEKDFARLEDKAKAFYAYKGRLAESAAVLKAAIEASDELDRFGEKLYTYAHLLADENTSVGKNRARFDRICAKFSALSEMESWFDPTPRSLPFTAAVWKNCSGKNPTR